MSVLDGDVTARATATIAAHQTSASATVSIDDQVLSTPGAPAGSSGDKRGCGLGSGFMILLAGRALGLDGCRAR